MSDHRDTVIFDLDGTLALIDHRRHLVEGESKDWDAFYRSCVHDEPNWPVIKVFRELQEGGFRMLIFSGRSNLVVAETLRWLRAYGIFYNGLHMRKHGDFAPDEQLKETWLNQLGEDRNRVLCVFDDRDKVVDMWRRNGLTCFQVAAGPF